MITKSRKVQTEEELTVNLRPEEREGKHLFKELVKKLQGKERTCAEILRQSWAQHDAGIIRMSSELEQNSGD